MLLDLMNFMLYVVDANYEAWPEIKHFKSTRPNNTHRTMDNSLPFVDTSHPYHTRLLWYPAIHQLCTIQ